MLVSYKSNTVLAHSELYNHSETVSRESCVVVMKPISKKGVESVECENALKWKSRLLKLGL